MNTPICDFVKQYTASGVCRLHMPGHKGRPFLGAEPYDITEFDGADVLYSANGIIKESEANAASLFETAITKYSAEGSSLSIRAMLYLAVLCAKEKGMQPLIAAGRNAHKTLVNAAAMLDLDIMWLHGGDDSILSCKITPESLEKALSCAERTPTALYITSPDYLGNISDISGLSKVCKKHGMMLLVDNAHGAYLKFLPEKRHPIDLGADICCDSAHKTLPVLTGGGYLHISHSAPPLCHEMAESAMSLFASTSPSYLILQSLDAANRYISEGYRERLAKLSDSLIKMRKKLVSAGFTVVGDEPVKMTVMPKTYGYTGAELSAILNGNGFVCEFYDSDHTVMMFTPEITEVELARLENVLTHIPKRCAIKEKPPAIIATKRALSIRDAVLSPSEEIAADKAEGRVLADANVACPPAIPIAVCGEVITEAAIEAFRYYGIEQIRVVK